MLVPCPAFRFLFIPSAGLRQDLIEYGPVPLLRNCATREPIEPTHWQIQTRQSFTHKIRQKIHEKVKSL